VVTCLTVACEITGLIITMVSFVFIMKVNVAHSLGHRLHTFAAVTIVDLACYPPWEGKMSLSILTDQY